MFHKKESTTDFTDCTDILVLNPGRDGTLAVGGGKQRKPLKNAEEPNCTITYSEQQKQQIQQSSQFSVFSLKKGPQLVDTQQPQCLPPASDSAAVQAPL